MKNTLWHYQSEGRPQGPVSEEELLALLASGKLKPSDLVWHKGLSEWIEISRSSLTQPAASHQPPVLPGEAASLFTEKSPPPLPKKLTKGWGIGCLFLALLAVVMAGVVIALAFWAFRSAQEEVHSLLKKPLPQEVPIPPAIPGPVDNVLKLPNLFPHEIAGAEKVTVAAEKALHGTSSYYTATYHLPSGGQAVVHLIGFQWDGFFTSFLSSLRKRKDIRAIWANEAGGENERKTYLFSTAYQGLYLIRENQVMILVTAPSPGDAEEIGEKLKPL